ncbi:psbP domain-containing protein 3, chloroplastic isoform X1 [Ziziphus jujuba]|uniref:PsbP domain-containing protein 3, chloroplastic isoform X1 n=1 Tax=Ziziphus jujuba TaxID=326968 RepID=A0A6P4AEJ1_ZIZJJ|nr:psbP domain-containing protein 3, chloroplastic isoform X1 [Ziziphus jujuba]
MACVGCWCAPGPPTSARRPNSMSHPSVLCNTLRLETTSSRFRLSTLLRSNNSQHKKQSCFGNSNIQQQQEEECGGARRRQILIGTTTLFAAASCFPAIVWDASAASVDNNNSNNNTISDAVPEGFRLYTDDVNKFKILIPKDWKVGTGEPNGFKSVTAFYPGEASSSNVSVVITGIGPDFTKMESFGKVEEFAETLVSGLDRSWQRPPGVTAKLQDSKAKNGFYYITYSLQNPGESRRYLLSALGMSSNGYYNKLYTVTGQFVEEESEKYSTQIEKAVTSFRFL